MCFLDGGNHQFSPPIWPRGSSKVRVGSRPAGCKTRHEVVIALMQDKVLRKAGDNGYGPVLIRFESILIFCAAELHDETYSRCALSEPNPVIKCNMAIPESVFVPSIQGGRPRLVRLAFLPDNVEDVIEIALNRL